MRVVCRSPSIKICTSSQLHCSRLAPPHLTASRLLSRQQLCPLRANSDGDEPTTSSGTTSTKPSSASNQTPSPPSDGPIPEQPKESPPSQSPQSDNKKPDSSKPTPSKPTINPLLFQIGPGGRRSPPTEMVFAGLGAYTGLVGSAAIFLAWATHVDLFNSFRWEAADIQTALQYLIPLQIINAAILLPSYSSWSLTSTGSDISSLKMQLAASKARSGGSGASSSDQGSSKQAAVPAAVNPLRTINDGMNLAQGHYIANNPTGNLSVGLEAVVAVMESLAGELLYRGVLFVIFSRWVTDRLYEGGADDTILLPIRILGTDHTVLLTTIQAAQWTATALSVLALGAAVVQKNLKARKRYEAVVNEVKLGLSVDKNGKPLIAKAGKVDDKQPKIIMGGARPGAYDAMSFGAVVQGTLELTNLLTVNSIFIVTGGNLAATFAASATNEIIFSLFQRFATQRLQKRSLEMATELQSFNSKLAALVNKKGKLQAGMMIDEDAGGLRSASSSSNPIPTPTPTDSQDTTPSPPSPTPASSNSRSSSSSAPQQPQSDSISSQSTATGTTAEGSWAQPASPVAPTASQSGSSESPSVQSHPVSAPPSAPATALSRTLSVLDMMLPPDEPKPKAKKPEAVVVPVKETDTANRV